MLLTEGSPLVAKLADLGEARFKKSEGSMTSVGTPFYSSPEILLGDDSYDEKVDS